MDNKEHTYQQLQSHFNKIGELENIAEIAYWDEATMMPEGSGEARGKSLATLSGVIHELKTDIKIRDWLLESEGNNSLDLWQKANVFEIRRIFDECSAIPVDLTEKLEERSFQSEQAWRRCRSANDWTSMLPLLSGLIELVREKAQILGEIKNTEPYDALLDQYEHGVTSESIEGEFDKLKRFLPDFLEDVLTIQKLNKPTPLVGPFEIAKQRELGIQVMASMGFDFDKGRLDVSHHPFCGGTPDDTRITTRYNEDGFEESLMGVIHETGHALYEQGLPSLWRNQPVGLARSMAMHESQSLLMEMQACRSEEFLTFLTPFIQEKFGAGLGETNAQLNVQNIRLLYRKVEKGLIRVDADEVTYPLHVILRFEIERDLINGKIEVQDIPGVWDQKMLEYLGANTEGNYQDGCLQDVHWPSGLFGYFPSYTIGAMTAAQLFRTATNSDLSIMTSLAVGDFTPLVGWLKEHIHSRGSSVSFDQLLIDATGEPLNSDHFINHLKARYQNDT